MAPARWSKEEAKRSFAHHAASGKGSMNRRTAGLLAWSIELVCVAMVVASLVLL